MDIWQVNKIFASAIKHTSQGLQKMRYELATAMTILAVDGSSLSKKNNFLAA